MYGYIFYTKTCPKSKNLMKIMENQGLLNMFEYKCVDDMSDLEVAKLTFNEVPTLVVVGMDNGKRTQRIYSGQQAFDWVDAVVMNRRKQSLAQSETTRKVIQLEDTKKRLKTGLYEYCADELTGISDSYSFWKDDLTQDNSDVSHAKSFLPVGQDTAYSIMTIPEDKKMKGYKLTENVQKKLISELETQRKQQDGQLKKIMETDQIKAVISNNHS